MITLGSQENVDGSRELLALPQNRSRTASELLGSRYGDMGMVGWGCGGQQGWLTPPVPCRQLYFTELEESERFYESHNRFLKLLLAMYRCVATHSELLCYFIIILNNIVTASIITLFLPILVFLWAMLSIPRPTKRFWITAIIFTEVGRWWLARGQCHPAPACHPLTPVSLQVMVVVKYLFQFGFFPWNCYAIMLRNEGKPFFPPRIMGLEKSDRYIKYDLMQLLALFFHRSLLLVSPRAWASPWALLGWASVGAGGVMGTLKSTQWVLGGSTLVSTQGTIAGWDPGMQWELML